MSETSIDQHTNMPARTGAQKYRKQKVQETIGEDGN